MKKILFFLFFISFGSIESIVYLSKCTGEQTITLENDTYEPQFRTSANLTSCTFQIKGNVIVQYLSLTGTSNTPLFKLDPASSLTLINVNVSDTVAVFFSMDGRQKASINITSCVFTQNGLGTFDSVSVTVTDSTFEKNTDRSRSKTSFAKFFSTPLRMRGSSLTVSDTVITGNSANVGDGLNSGGFLYAESSSLNFIRTEFTGNYASDNGGVFYLDQSDITITDSKTIEGNRAQEGAVVFAVRSNVSISGSTFKGNTAIVGSGGALYLVGTIQFPSILTSVSSSYEKNSAKLNGGAIYANVSALNLSDNTFYLNQANGNGGAISSSLSALTIRGGFCTDNKANFGGAVYLSDTNTTISEVDFVENGANLAGGAIACGANELKRFPLIVLINGSNFLSNTVQGGQGGAIVFYGFATNTDPHFYFYCYLALNVYSMNQALEGGAVYIGNPDYNSFVQSDSEEFYYNTASRGGAVSSTSNYAISNAIAVKNNASVEGGTFAVSSSKADFSFIKVFIKDSYASLSGGSFLINSAKEVNFEEVVISGSSTLLQAGAIEVEGFLNSFKIKTSYIGESYSVLQGGAINFKENSILKYFEVSLSFFNMTGVYLRGGAIRFSGGMGSVVVKDSYFYGCSAFEGGALNLDTVDLGDFLLDNVTFQDNRADNSGGAVYVGIKSVIRNSFKVKSSSFYNSRVKTEGGAIFFNGFNSTKPCVIENTKFVQNEATSGSAIAADPQVVFYLFNIIKCGFYSNLGKSGSGGAIRLTVPSSSFTLDGSTFESNRAQQGGALWLYPSPSQGSISITNSRFDDNIAQVYNGAALFLGISSPIFIFNTTFSRNRAQSNGAAIWISNSISTSISECTFDSNQLEMPGVGSGLFYKSSGSLTVSNSLFTNNYAGPGEASSGSGIYVEGLSSKVSIINSKFISNLVSGAVTFRGNFTSIEITSGTFEGNNAVKPGGAIRFSEGFAPIFTIDSTNFTGNSAPSGGAVDVTAGIETMSLLNVLMSSNLATIRTPRQNIDLSPTSLTGGGGLRVFPSVLLLKVSGGVFGDNIADSGGALFIVSKKFTIDRAFFGGNEGDKCGGAVSALFTVGKVTSSTFENNAADCGSGLFVARSGVSVGSLSSFRSNTALKTGAGIHLAEFSGINVYDSTFERNAAIMGAAIHLLGNSTIVNCRFVNNNASVEGGAVGFSTKQNPKRQESEDYQLTLSKNKFINNTAVNSGAITFNNTMSPETVSISKNEFSGNSATELGGAIGWRGSLFMDGNTFVSNSNSAPLGSGMAFRAENGVLKSQNNSYNGHTVYIPAGSNLVIDSNGEPLPGLSCKEGKPSKSSSSSVFCDTSSNSLINNNGKNTNSTMWIIIGCAVGGFLLLVIIVAIVLLKRRQRRIEKEKQQSRIMTQLLVTDVKFGSLIGKGNFGEVYKGAWNGTAVALKGLSGEDQNELRKFKEEINLLYKLNHPNIVRLLGLNVYNNQTYMVLEFVENGSLDRFLRAPNRETELNTEVMIEMTFDVTKGMMYLQAKGVIHRDLSARNLLVDGSNKVKISDFGLSKENDFYEAKSKAIPYKWTAPEVISDQRSTFASDVWSFGVVVWEIFSFGMTPYGDFSNKETVEKVTAGFRMAKPNRCPDTMYKTMLKCWDADPQNRPSFSDLYSELLEDYPDILHSQEQTISKNSTANSRYTKKEYYVGGGSSQADSEIEMVTMPSYKFDDQV